MNWGDIMAHRKLDGMNRKAAAANFALLDGVEDYESYIISNNLDLKKEILRIKKELEDGADIEDFKAQIFALVRVASTNNIGLTHFDIQLITSNVVSSGHFAEMKTGEGKTLAITPAAVYKALEGRGVHIFTSNDYLAKTNYEELKPLYEALGLSVGLITSGMSNEEKRRAYASDIVYGSSEIIFDMLRDNTTVDSDDLVYRRASFAIVDEADDIFIDSARTPYIVSGQLDSLEIDEDDKEQLQDLNSRYKKANNFVMEEIYKKWLADRRVVRYYETYEEFSEINSERNYNYGPNVYAVAIGSTNQVMLTEMGWLKAYEFYCRNKVNELTEEYKNDIIASHDFSLNVDYIKLDEGRIKLTDSGLKKAVETFAKFKEHNDSFYSDPLLFANQHYIDNSLAAYFMISRGVEYELIDDNGKQRVSLVINGRTSNSRSYSDGLQQAIELKEISFAKLMNKGGRRPNIKTTAENNEIASTSTIAFFQTMYDDYAGLTGTAPKKSFYDLYGKDTVELPKNVDFEGIEHISRVDNPTRVYKNETDKMNAIINDIRVRHAKGQPILIGTTSVEESEYIARRLMEEGFTCNVLNAKVTDLEKEGKIVAEAGKPKAITVATNMAGRGTDIKLGGTLESALFDVLSSYKKKQFEEWEKIGIPEDEYEVMFSNILADQTKQTLFQEKAKQVLEQRRKAALESGGLYVLGASLNKVKRVDDQLRGRSGRQADPGESRFYTTLDELVKLGVDKDSIKMVEDEFGNKKYVESGLSEGVIAKAQELNEGQLSDAIFHTQEFDKTVSKFQESIYSQRKRVVEGKEDLTPSINFIIEKTVEDTIGYNIPENKNVTGKTKVKRSKLEYKKLSEDIKTNFGIDISAEELSTKFYTIKDMAVYLSDIVKNNYQNSCRGKTKAEIQNQNRQIILSTLDSAWLEFRTVTKISKEQQILDKFVGNDDHDRIYELKQRYNKSIRQARMEIMQKTFGLEKKKVNTLEDLKDKKLSIDMLDVDNTYAVDGKIRRLTVFGRAMDVLSKPFKAKRKLEARKSRREKLNNIDNELRDNSQVRVSRAM